MTDQELNEVYNQKIKGLQSYIQKQAKTRR